MHFGWLFLEGYASYSQLLDTVAAPDPMAGVLTLLGDAADKGQEYHSHHVP